MEDDIKQVAPEKLAHKFQSKRDLYNILSIDRKLDFSLIALVEYFLPSYDKCFLLFLRQFLAQEKKVGVDITYLRSIVAQE